MHQGLEASQQWIVLGNANHLLLSVGASESRKGRTGQVRVSCLIPEVA